MVRAGGHAHGGPQPFVRDRGGNTSDGWKFDFNPGEKGGALVEARLAACVNIIERVHSVYRWEGTVAEEGEHLLLIKTVESKVDALREALLEMHPYEVPEFVVLPIESMSAFPVARSSFTTASWAYLAAHDRGVRF